MQAILHRIAASAFAALVASQILAPAIVHAQAAKIERIDVFDPGIYCSETIGKILQPGAPGGYVNLISEPKLLKRTTQIPMQIGTRFGMLYAIVGSPMGARVDVRVVARVPSPGFRDPATGETMLVSDYSIAGRIGATSFRGNHLEFDWELLAGVWTFEFWDNDRKLATQSFSLATVTSAQRRNWGNANCAPLIGSINVPTIVRRN